MENIFSRSSWRKSTTKTGPGCLFFTFSWSSITKLVHEWFRMYLRVNVFSVSSFLIVFCIGWYIAQNLRCNWNLILTRLRHTLHCNPGFLHTEEISKIHQNPFARKINISSLVFTFFLHFNSLNTRSKSTSSLFDIFTELTKI